MDEDTDLEQTRWDRFRSRRSRYEGDERRGPAPPNLLAYLPLLLACLAGVAGYVQQGADIKSALKQIDRVEQTHKEWHLSLTHRIRELERGE